MARSLGVAFVAAGVMVSVLTLLVPLDSLSVSCILFGGAFLMVFGFAIILSPGPSIAYRLNVKAPADYALRSRPYYWWRRR